MNQANGYNVLIVAVYLYLLLQIEITKDNAVQTMGKLMALVSENPSSLSSQDISNIISMLGKLASLISDLKVSEDFKPNLCISHLERNNWPSFTYLNCSPTDVGTILFQGTA